MKRSVRIVISAILLAVSVGLWMSTAIAATQATKQKAIQSGLAYLHATQQSGGYWMFSGYETAATGAAVFSLLSQENKWGNNTVTYNATVTKGIAYLLSVANTIDISTRSDGVNICPGRAGSCTGVYWFGNSRSTFTTGLIAPAIAAYGLRVGSDTVATHSGPLAGMTWAQIAQGITNTLAVSQSTNDSGNRAGGWSNLIPGNGDATSADTALAVQSLIHNETIGANTPEATKDRLRIWLGHMQSEIASKCSQADAVSSCVDADVASWLVGVKFVGYGPANPELQDTLSALEHHWTVTSGLFAQPLTMWSVYQGLTVSDDMNVGVRINLLIGCHSSTTVNEDQGQFTSRPCIWLEDYKQWLTDKQNSDGSWTTSGVRDPFATAFAIAILGDLQTPLHTQRKRALGIAQPSETSISKATQRAATSMNMGQVDSTFISMTPSGPHATISKKIRRRTRKGVTAIAVSEDGSTLASAGTDKRIVVWNPATGTQRFALEGSLGIPTGLAFSRAGLISVGKDSVVRLWDRTNGRQLAQLAGHESAINTIAASPNGAWMATAGEGTRIMLWDQNTRKLAKVLFGAKDFINTLAFSLNSQLLAAAGEDANVLLFEANTGKLLFTLPGHSASIDTVAFSPNGTMLASGGEDTTIHVWDTVKGRQLQVLRGHQGPIRSIAFSRDGQLIASAGEDLQIRLWNAAAGTLTKVLSGSTAPVNTVLFDPLGVFMASATESGDITLWSVLTGTKLITLRIPGLQ